jgi:hypothetical protein
MRHVHPQLNVPFMQSKVPTGIFAIDCPRQSAMAWLTPFALVIQTWNTSVPARNVA